MIKNIKNNWISRRVLWPKVLFYLFLHLFALVGLYLAVFQAKWMTILFTIILIYYSFIGVTAGAHRLWSHASYKANIFLRGYLALGQTLICEGSIYHWAKNHRLHHKHFSTENDPYNPERGFLFAHFTNRIVSGHPDYQKHLNVISSIDLINDPIILWQMRLYWLIAPVLILVSVFLPIKFWGESFMCSVFIVGFFRIIVSLHSSWMIHAATIVWGLDPLNRYSIHTNMVFIVNKSLWPQYHYIIPWDFQCGEYGNYNHGCATAHIRVWAALRWVTELRTLDTEGLRKAMIESSTTGEEFNKCVEKHTFDPNLLKIKCELDLERLPL